MTTEGPDFVAPEERVAVFDNDGTLWCEKPMYIQLDFLLRRFKEQAEADPSLRDQQPYKAAYTGDLKWLGDAVTKHYQGDDTDLKPLWERCFRPITDHRRGARRRVNAFFAEAKHPTLGRPYTSCGYAPMVELLRYLEANGFTSYIVSGGGRDFMRPVTCAVYGIPPERVVGSSVGSRLPATATSTPPTSRSSSTTGRSNRCDCGAGSGAGRSWRPETPTATSRCWSSTPTALRLLVLHDDADREFDYTAGAEKALEQAAKDGWTVVSMKNDWATVFSDLNALVWIPAADRRSLGSDAHYPEEGPPARSPSTGSGSRPTRSPMPSSPNSSLPQAMSPSPSGRWIPPTTPARRPENLQPGSMVFTRTPGPSTCAT